MKETDVLLREDGVLTDLYNQINDESLRSDEKLKDTLIIIGNGFTISLLNGVEINSSKPLSNFQCKNIKIDCMSKMPGLESIIEEGKKIYPDNDFKVFEYLLNKYSEKQNYLCYMRRYIIYAYSKLYIEGLKHINYSEWKWTKWFKENKNRICGIYDLNYDLFLEDLLNFLNISYYRVSTISHQKHIYCKKLNYMIPIYKPHGSIDFDIYQNFTHMPEEGVWSTETNENQCCINGLYVMSEISRMELLKPRFEVDLIPPNSTNIYRNLSWIKQIYNQMSYDIKNIKNIICFGFSYSEFDQPEFEEILDKCNNKDIKIYDININENHNLAEYVTKKGFTYIFKNAMSYECNI
ncbi:hypothetical protein ACHM2U_01305 [Clostridium perfringens]|uniref:hypothetical protein n=1 Tax=Clostridium perfringens TaxID=1502 RepID=UPI0029778A07|nr:hypothetical protein [Clostridium perfringens]MDK0642733.1 hypothetical protein [Clostridium perfringens]MDK0865130.1 hypothetical protein [Clostridium perfringens]MDM0764258.1 hypothetical protein [Clostridium perfringens]